MSENEQRRFRSTEHLATEAIAAYVDGELTMTAHLRAANHLAQCPDCAAEVDAQQHASGALRRLPHVAMPSSLLGVLNEIPQCDHTPCDPAGLTRSSDGRRWSLRWRK